MERFSSIFLENLGVSSGSTAFLAEKQQPNGILKLNFVFFSRPQKQFQETVRPSQNKTTTRGDSRKKSPSLRKQRGNTSRIDNSPSECLFKAKIRIVKRKRPRSISKPIQKRAAGKYIPGSEVNEREIYSDFQIKSCKKM